MLTGSCPTGYITDDFDCIDENECVANNGHGPCQDTCTNTEGSFHCSCEGLPGTRLASDQKTCEEIDLCEQNNGGCSHDCHTSYGQVSILYIHLSDCRIHAFSFQSFCMCPTGMKLDIDWKTCIQENPNSADVNAPNCDNWYRLNSLTNECEDIDECGDDRPCGAHGTCINQVPGYNCECNVGYEFDGTTCVDKNECMYQACGNGVCINTDGSYQCQCHEGYSITSDGTCQDTDECQNVSYFTITFRKKSC